MFIDFGAGDIWINPIGGNEATNPTPYRPLTLQDLSFDVSQELVELRGQMKFPDDVAPADMKVTGKISFGRVDFAMLNQVLFGDVQAVNGKQIAVQGANVPASTPFTITVTNSAQFGTDLGVQYAGLPPTGFAKQFTRVTGTPTQGQYAVSAGVYTFAAADEAAPVQISYEYLPASGPTITTDQVNNQLMGYGPVCEVYYAYRYTTPNGGSAGAVLHICSVRFSKMSMPKKRKGYTITELDYEAFPNASGLVYDTTNAGSI